MPDRPFHFDAFICYKISTDKKIAMQLYKQIMNFKVPKKVIIEERMEGTVVKEKINNVFIDEKGITSGSLWDIILDRLEESEFLVVVCSKSTPESICVNKEIDHFIKIGRSKNILALLVEGDITESFPQQLLDLNIFPAKIDSDTYKGRIENLKQAKYKLIAPIIDSKDPERLKKYSEARFNRKIVLALTTAIVVLTGISTTFAYLWNKNNVTTRNLQAAMHEVQRKDSEILTYAGKLEIERNNALVAQKKAEKQTEIAKRQTKIAEEQTKNAQKQRDLALYNQSLMLANFSQQQTEKGYPVSGMLLALESLPVNINTPNRPYAYEAKLALLDAFYTPKERGSLKEVYNCLAVSSDSKLIAACHVDNYLRVWDSNLNVLASLKKEVYIPTKIIFSPDDNFIICTNGHYSNIWQAKTMQEVLTVKSQVGNHDELLYSVNGLYALTVNNNKPYTAKLWNVLSGKVIASYNLPDDSFYEKKIYFDKDSTRVYIENSKECSIIRLTDGKLLGKIGKGSYSFTQISPNSNYYEIFSGTQSKWLRGIYDINNNETIYLGVDTDFLGERGIFSSTGKYYLYKPPGKTAELWDLERGEVAQEFKIGDGNIRGFFSPDDKFAIISEERGDTFLWNILTGDKITYLPPYQSAAYSPDGKYFYIKVDDIVNIYNGISGYRVCTLKLTNSFVNDIIFTPGNELIAVDNHYGRIWDINGIKDDVLSWENTLVNSDFNSVNHLFMDISGDGSSILSYANNANISIANVNGGAGREVSFNDNVVKAFFSSPDDSIVVVLYNGEVFRLKNPDDRPLNIFSLREVNNTNNLYVGEFYINQDGSRLMAQITADNWQLWDIKEKELLFSGRLEIQSGAFSPISSQLNTFVSANGSEICIWNADSGKIINNTRGEGTIITFNSDGEYFIAADYNGCISCFDKMGNLINSTKIANDSIYSYPENKVCIFGRDNKHVYINCMQHIYRWDMKNNILASVTDGANAYTIDKAENYMAYSGYKGMTISRIDTGEIIAKIKENGAYNLFLDTANGYIFAGLDDGTVRRWKLFFNTQDLIDYCRLTTSREITNEEKMQFNIEKQD